jgi:hypothetical protein
MKKTSLIFILFTLLSNYLFAQTGRESDLRFAFTLSPQVSWISSDETGVNGNGNLFGYNFGVEMDKFFAKNYAVNSGLTINTTGGKLKYNNPNTFTIGGESKTTSTDTTLEYRLKYIEIPLALKLQTSDFQRTSFYGVFGMSTQFNIKTNDGTGKNLNDEVRFFSLGYHFGGGIQYSIGGDAYLKTGITYSQGITDITNNSTIDDTAILNRLVFNFGIIF